MKTVLCHGVFDVLHPGHIAHFEAAKKIGGEGCRLVVSVTKDRFIQKGPGRPYFDIHKRMAMLRALSIVDEVFEAPGPTATEAIDNYKPDFFIKGEDYKDLTKDVTGEIYNEKRHVERNGGRLVFTEGIETNSSSKIINAVFQERSQAQRKNIQEVLESGGLVRSTEAIEAIQKLRIGVIGEPIIDVYRFVNPEGISSKSPTVSARFQYEEQYQGGALAVYNHLKGFSSHVEIQHHSRTAKKIRYISGTQRIFEVTEINDQPWIECNRDFFIEKSLELARRVDLLILADFGHGMFDKEVLKAFESITTFVALNVQTNSSNFGYNPYHKHKRFDFLSIDTREARLAEHDRFSSPLEIAERIADKIAPRALAVTLGPNGSCLYTDKGFYQAEAFANNVVDAIGAGDAFFAMAACLLKTGCPEPIIPFLANVFAGLKTQILGNKNSVSKASLIKAITGILK